MEQYISKAAVVAEIKRRRDFIFKRNPYLINSGYCIEEDNAILNFLDTLEVKDVDAIKCDWYNQGYIKGRKEANIPARELGLPKSCDFHQEQSEVDLDKEFDKYCSNLYLIDFENEPYAESFERAKHFFELWIKAQKGE